MRLLILAIVFGHGATEERWRETLLSRARERILVQYTDPDLIEPQGARDGIAMHMLKNDQSCGGDLVPVTFVEFIVKDARPVDIFNTMLDTANQKLWDPTTKSVTSLGDWKSEGARAWSMTFKVPLVNDRQFVQWQVADANVTSEEFWIVFSTRNNSELRKMSPIRAGATESQNCLGAYHITNHVAGARVVITQHVNAHAFLLFPLHQILKLFPLAWTATLDFVHHLTENSKKLAALGYSHNLTGAPLYMLQGPANTSPTIRYDRLYSPLQVSQDAHTSMSLGVFLLVVLCSIGSFAVVGIGLGRSIAAAIRSMRSMQNDSIRAGFDSFALASQSEGFEQEGLV